MFSLEKVKNTNKCNIFFIINLFLVIIILSIVIFSICNIYTESFNNNSFNENFANINDTDNIKNSLDLGLCSRKCCPPYWSNDKIIDNRIKDEEIGKSIYTSNLFCSNGDGNKGCICLTDNSVNILSNRGFTK